MTNSKKNVIQYRWFIKTRYVFREYEMTRKTVLLEMIISLGRDDHKYKLQERTNYGHRERIHV